MIRHPLSGARYRSVVIGRYYRIVLDDGTVIDAADEALDRIEAMAAEAVGETMQRLVEKQRGAGHEPW